VLLRSEYTRKSQPTLSWRAERLVHDVVLCCSKFCHCALDGATRGELRPVQLQYYEALKQLIEVSGRYDQKEDFTVVLQPFMRDWLPPKDVSDVNEL